MRHLCDSNVFVASILDKHPHHLLVKEWMDSLEEDSTLCFCRISQVAFLRIITTKEAMADQVKTNEEAFRLSESLCSKPEVELLLEEPFGLDKYWKEYAKTGRASPKRWADAYLAAFARTSELRLVTLDKAFSEFKGVDLLILKEANPL